MFKDELRKLRIDNNFTQEDLAKKLDVSKSTISMYESGSRIPGLEMLEAIADFFNIDMNRLTSNGPQLKSHFDIPNILPMPKMKKVPRLGIIACGEPILAAENIEAYDTVPDDIHCDFSLRCRGDSMINARIFDGDIVYIRAQSVVESGEIAAVLIGDDATLKRIRLYDDHISLEPENPQYRPIVIWGEEMNAVRILGKAVYFTSAVR